MSDDSKPLPPPNPQEAVVFKLSDHRLKAKKQAAKDRREFIRDRLREPKIAR